MDNQQHQLLHDSSRRETAVGYYGPASHSRDWDNKWETNTAITANTSLHSGSIDLDLNLVGKNSSPSNSMTGGRGSKRIICPDEDFFFRYRMDAGFIVSTIVSICALISPIIMIILPRVNSLKWNVSEPGPECDGILISFTCKLLLLSLATWLLFVRKPRAAYPGTLIYRAVILVLIFVLLLCYWLFYSIRASERKLADYDLPFKDLLLSYPVPLVENLLWIHYLAVILMEIRHHRKEYYIKVIRSPDGVSKSYSIGSFSIQRTAVWVLEKYYTEFPIYNPHLDVISSSKKKDKSSGDRINVFSDSLTTTQGTPGNRGSDEINGGVKYYDIDGMNLMNHNQQQQQQQQQQQGYQNINSSTPNSNITQFSQQNQANGGLVSGSNVGIVMPSSPRSTRFQLNQSANLMSGGSNSIYSLTRNNHHQSNHLSSKKSHSVVGVETSKRGSSSRSSSSHHHHHHRSSRSGSRDRDHSHHRHHRDRSREREREHLNDKFHEEFEFEKKVKKRRMRLVSSAEEAFTHIKLVGDNETQGGAITMNPHETAQAIFPSMARPLQKYLRVTRQQQRHTLSSILDHLSTAMKYGLSAKTFLEKYLSTTPVLNDDNEANKTEDFGDKTWGLVSDVLVSRSIRDGTIFMLRQGDVSLLVTISSLPFFHLREEVIDPTINRYVFRLNSETSV